MSLLIADTFIEPEGRYVCYWDTATNSGVVDFTGPGPQQSYYAIPDASGGMGRSYNPGDIIGFQCDGTTKYTFRAQPGAPFVSADIETDSTDCPVTPPGTCDIQITSVVTTDETDTGANDGTVTIGATTSAGGLQYSIDNVTFQAGNVFTGLAPGTYGAFVKDANDCTAEQPFNIFPYSNPVQSFSDDLPVVTVGGNVSKWNAVFNPIVVKFQRKDYTITSITDAGSGNIYVKPDSALTFDQYNSAVTTGFVFKSLRYDYLGLAVSYDATTGFTVKLPYVGDDTGGYMNLITEKPQYRIQIELTTGNDPVFKQTIIGEFSSNLKGATFADLAVYLQTLLSTNETYDYLLSNYKDYNLAGSFTMRYREYWNGAAGPWFSAPYPLYFTFAARQLGELYNGNMADYVPFLSGSQAKFLTGFESPTYFSGLPFEISFIYSDAVINKQLYLELNPNCGTTENALLLNADAGYLLNADTSRFVIERVVDPNVQGYPIIAQLGVNRLRIPDVFDCCADKIIANIYFDSQDPATFDLSLTEDVTPFIDGGIQGKDNETEFETIDSTGTSNGHIVTAGHAYSIEAYVSLANTATNPKLNIVIQKDGVTIFQKTVAAVAGASMVKTGVAQPGAHYTVVVTTTENTADLTLIDISDEEPVTIGKTYIMQPLTINYVCPCDDKYVYLKWINSRGAWDYWRFGYNQEKGQTTSNSQQISRYVDNWTTDQTIQDFISRTAIKKLTLVAGGLSAHQIDALQWLTNSIKVQMFTGMNPIRWQTVIISDGDATSYNTKQNGGNFKTSISLPAVNLQNQ